MGGGGGKGSTTSQSSSAPPPQVMAQYEYLMGRANQAGSQPYTQYGGQMLAPFSNEQLQGFQTVNDAQGIAQPYFNAAANYATLGSAPISAPQIANYTNPYQQQVVNATLGNLNELNAEQQTQLTGNLMGSGGLFNDRMGVAQAELARQQSLSEAPTIAGLQASGFTQALGAAQADRAAAAQGAYTFGNLGTANLAAILQGAQAQLATGSQEQQQAQQGLNIPYQQFQQAQGFPYQQLSWLSSLSTGLGSNMGGTSTTTTTPPASNSVAPFIGLGLTGLGFLKRGGGINVPYMPREREKREDGGG